jgi:hypothetical protein
VELVYHHLNLRFRKVLYPQPNRDFPIVSHFCSGSDDGHKPKHAASMFLKQLCFASMIGVTLFLYFLPRNETDYYPLMLMK